MSDFNPLDRARVAVHRSSFDLSSKKLFTAKIGEILPCYCQIASRMLRAPDFDLAELINSNAATLNYFDGLSFFNTAHPISPGSTVTFSNDITCTTSEWESGEGLSKLLDAFASIPWFDVRLS